MLKVSWAVDASDASMRSEMSLRMPFSGVSVKGPGKSASARAALGTSETGGAGAARSATPTRPPRAVPAAGTRAPEATAARAAAVRAGRAAAAAITSRSMTRPPGPVPGRADASIPSAAARLRARGEAGASAACAWPAPAAGAICATGAALPCATGLAGAAGFSGAGATSPPAAATAAFQSSPACPITAMGASTGTSSPSGLRILRSTPAEPAGTSKVALSVSTSQTAWSAATDCPSAAFQPTMTQDSTVFP